MYVRGISGVVMSFVGWTAWKGSDDWQGRKMFMGRNKEDLDTEIYTIWMGLKETRDHKDDWADLGLGAKTMPIFYGRPGGTQADT
jgi:hypothetical protein